MRPPTDSRRQVGDTEHARTAAVVSGLVGSGLVDAERAGEARAVVDAALSGRLAGEAPLRRRLAEVAGYVGGALVVAAAVIFLTEEWETLPTSGRVGALATLTLLLAGAAVAVHVLGRRALPAGDEGVRRRLASALASGGAVAAGFAVGVLVESATQPFSDIPWAAGGLVVVVAGLAGYALAPSALGQVTLVVAAAVTAGAAIDAFWEPVSEVPFAVAMLAIGAGWLLLVERGLLAEKYAGLVLGCVFVLFGAQYATLGSDEAWVAYLLTTAVVVVAVLAYVRRRTVPYLVTAVAGITLVVPEALLDWTEGSLGPVGALLATGVTLLVASLLGLRLRQEVGTPVRPGGTA
jgi:hypothetical protein